MNRALWVAGRSAALVVVAGLNTQVVAQGPELGPTMSPGCLPTASRTRGSCEPTKIVVETEHEVTVTLDLPLPKTTACEATIEFEYTQRDDVVSVEGTIENKTCAASSGDYKIGVSVRSEIAGPKTLEFVELWQRTDDQPIHFSAVYPIGKEVDLVSVRSRQLRCICAD